MFCREEKEKDGGVEEGAYIPVVDEMDGVEECIMIRIMIMMAVTMLSFINFAILRAAARFSTVSKTGEKICIFC
jgi:hypothetical protein